MVADLEVSKQEVKQPGGVEPDQGKSGSEKKEPIRKTSLTRIRDRDGRRGKKRSKIKSK